MQDRDDRLTVMYCRYKEKDFLIVASVCKPCINIIMILYVQLVEIYLAWFEVMNYFILYTSCTKY